VMAVEYPLCFFFPEALNHLTPIVLRHTLYAMRYIPLAYRRVLRGRPPISISYL
jgi:hypothetical protein